MQKKQCRAGMTMIEVMTAIMITGVSFFLVTLLISRVWQLERQTLATGDLARAATRAVERMADITRNAVQGEQGSYPLIAVSGDEFTLYSDYDRDGRTEHVRFFRWENGGIVSLRMGIIVPSNDVPPLYTGAEVVTTLIENIDNDGTEPLFEYFNRNNESLGANPIIQDVTMVRFSVMVENASPTVARIPVISFASIRNLSLNK